MSLGRVLVTTSFALAGILAVPQTAQALSSSTTTLHASSVSTTYDSAVTLTAKVTSNGGTPTGVVSFVDTSNGSVLGAGPVSGGKTLFQTAALAVGARNIVAKYRGTDTISASASAAVAVSVARGGDDAFTYQVDQRHDGDQRSGSLDTTRLQQKWNVTLGTPGSLAGGGNVSYPVIGGGRIFVSAENGSSYGTVLYALNATTGTTDWSVALAGTYGFSALAYDGQTVFALNFDGLVTAFAAATGHELWAQQMPGQYAFTAPPTAYDGVLYVSGAGSGGTVYAVREADGQVTWMQPVQNGDKSSPAVDDSGVYVSYACQQDYGFSLRRGAALWHYSTACEGGGGSTAVIYKSNVFARGANDSPVILSKSAGTLVGSFQSRTAPAFDSMNMYTLVNGNLVAVDPSGSPNRWTFSNGTLVTAPVVNGGTVFVGSSGGTVFGISAQSGVEVWSGVAGSTIVGPDEQNADVLVGMAVGGGELVVPAGNELTVFGD
jgi:outer membrane protein assembly factor BamB